MRKLCTIVMLVLCYCGVLRADLSDYIDDQTAVAGEADLTKLDADAMAAWLKEMATAMGAIGDEPGQVPTQRFESNMAQMKRWLNEFAQAGGKKVYVVTTGELIKDGAFALIAPADDPADAKAMAGLLFSGKADGPASRPNMTRENTGQLYPQWAEVIRDGKAAVYGTGNARNYAESVTPKQRPDIAEALAAFASSPVKLAFVPDEKMRREMEMMVPVKEIKWLALAVDLPPSASVKLLAQAHDAASATRARDTIAGLLQAIPTSAKMSPKFVELVTPVVEENRVVLTLDKDKLQTAAKELQPALREARLQAQRVASMSNMRQILVACIMHANDSKGAWPDDLKALEKYLGPSGNRVLTNPVRPDRGYVYVKPQQPRRNIAQTLVLYEEHDEFGEGVTVGFADGHVEFVKDKKRFDELLAAAKAVPPATAKTQPATP